MHQPPLLNFIQRAALCSRNSRRIKIISFRDVLFALIISIVPALLPVIAHKEMQLSAAQLGVVFTCVAIGSLAGAVFALPYLRRRISANAITYERRMNSVQIVLGQGSMAGRGSYGEREPPMAVTI